MSEATQFPMFTVHMGFDSIKFYPIYIAGKGSSNKTYGFHNPYTVIYSSFILCVRCILKYVFQ